MAPLGMALRAYLDGNSSAELVLLRDDGVEGRIPASHFFRDPLEASPVDRAAIEHSRGRVLDVGAGSGLHSLALQARGLDVTAIDVSPEAVEVMRKRGVETVREGDIFDVFDAEADAESFDTILMLGHGIGIVETLDGLDRFLDQLQRWLAEDGQLLVDSLEVEGTNDPATLAYHETNRKAGRYIGEVRVQLEHAEEKGPPCGWLHIDSETLTERARAHGFECEVLARNEGPDYLARLARL